VIGVKSIVIYASHFGNTKMIAEAIAGGLRARGTAQLLAVEEVPAVLPPGTDLVVIGGPTEAHRMTEPLAQYFDSLAPGALEGIAAAAFDTRLRMPRWLSGSAGGGITKKLRRTGARVIAWEESFFVKSTANTSGDKTPELEDGELERAGTWAVSLANQLEAKVSALASPAN
jgi:flavodoxin